MIYFSNFSEDDETNNNYASASLTSEFYPCVPTQKSKTLLLLILVKIIKYKNAVKHDEVPIQ